MKKNYYKWCLVFVSWNQDTLFQNKQNIPFNTIEDILNKGINQLQHERLLRLFYNFILSFKYIVLVIIINSIQMILEWCLIFAVTSVSVTMLMVVGAFLAIFPQAQQYYSQSRSMILLLSNCFNISYIIISPLVFNLLNKYYVDSVLIATIATGVAVIGRYLGQQNYEICLLMTLIVAIAHIPIITAPYGLLKLFPDSQKPSAASIPLFLPFMGMNFCILYGMIFITADANENITLQEVHAYISELNGIIAIVGIVSTVSTVVLMLKLRNKIQQHEHKNVIEDAKEQVVEVQLRQKFLIKGEALQKESESALIQNQNFIKVTIRTFKGHSKTAIVLIAWGSILGINWLYGSLFAIIFLNQNLSQKQMAIIGLAANISSVVFSNLGAYIKNTYKLQNYTVIYYLNLFGMISAIIIQCSRYITSFQNLYFLIFNVIVLKAGFSSFLSLAFLQMEKSGISSLVISGFFFWITNVVNLIGMELVDLVPTDLTLFLLNVIFGISIFTVHRMYNNGFINI